MIKAEGKWTCDKCGTKLSTRNVLLRHLKLQHLKAPFLFCDLCPYSYKRKSSLVCHMSKHMKSKPLLCHICGFSTIYKKTLDRHSLIHNEKSKCPICFKLVSNVKKHMDQTHFTEKSVKVFCTICSLAFTQRYISRHMEGHKKTFQCSKCNEVFVSRKSLKM